MADPVTPKKKSIPREVPPTPAVGEAVVKVGPCNEMNPRPLTNTRLDP